MCRLEMPLRCSEHSVVPPGRPLALYVVPVVFNTTAWYCIVYSAGCTTTYSIVSLCHGFAWPQSLSIYIYIYIPGIYISRMENRHGHCVCLMSNCCLHVFHIKKCFKAVDIQHDQCPSRFLNPTEIPAL